MSSRSRSAWSSSASGRSARSRPASTGRSRRCSRRPRATTFTADLVRIDGKPVDIGDGETAERHAAAIRAPATGRRVDREAPVQAQPGAAVHDQHAPAGGEPQARLQPQADDVDRPAAVRGRRHAGRPRRPHHLHADGLDRDRRRGHGRGAARSSATRFGERYSDAARAGSTRRRRRAPRRPTSRSGRPRSGAIPTRCARHLKAEELRLYRLIWQRAIASQMAPKELETTTAELVGGRVPSCGRSATRTLFDGFSRVYTEGQDDTPPRRPSARCRRSPRATRRRSSGHADPALHRAAAALHRGDADQGARGARHRPPVDVRGDDLHDRRSRLRPGRGAAPPSGGDRRDRHRPARHALRRVRGPRVHRPDGGRARRGRPRRARVGPAPARVLTPLKTRVDEKRRELKRADFTTEATDEVCSEGHPMVIRLGRNGQFLACSLYPEHKETRPLPGEEAPKLEGDGEPCPQCGEGTLATSAAGSGRSWAARATRTALHPQGRPAAARPAAVRGHLPQERRRPPRRASRAAHRQRLLGVLELPEVRLHQQRRADGRDPRRPTTGRSRAAARPGCA